MKKISELMDIPRGFSALLFLFPGMRSWRDALFISF